MDNLFAKDRIRLPVARVLLTSAVPPLTVSDPSSHDGTAARVRHTARMTASFRLDDWSGDGFGGSNCKP